MSLQYYPYEDLHVKPAVRPEGLEPGTSDYVPIAIIDLTLAMALVSFAVNGGVIGTLVVLGMTAWVQRAGAADRLWRAADPAAAVGSDAEREDHLEKDAGTVSDPQHKRDNRKRGRRDTGHPEKPRSVSGNPRLGSRVGRRRTRAAGKHAGEDRRPVASAVARHARACATARRGAGRSRICQ